MPWIGRQAHVGEVKPLHETGFRAETVGIAGHGGKFTATYGYLANALWEGKPVEGVVPDLAAALEIQRKAVAIDASLGAAVAADPRLQRQVMIDGMALAQLLEQAGDLAAARALYREGLDRTERLARADAGDLQAQKDLAWVTMRMGVLLARDGSPGEALVTLSRAAALFEPILAADPTNTNTTSMMAGTSEGFGKAHAALGADGSRSPEQRLGHWREAKARFQDAHAFWKALRDKGGAVARDASRPEELAAEIANCDTAIRAFGPRPAR